MDHCRSGGSVHRGVSARCGVACQASMVLPDIDPGRFSLPTDLLVQFPPPQVPSLLERLFPLNKAVLCVIGNTFFIVWVNSYLSSGSDVSSQNKIHEVGVRVSTLTSPPQPSKNKSQSVRSMQPSRVWLLHSSTIMLLFRFAGFISRDLCWGRSRRTC